LLLADAPYAGFANLATGIPAAVAAITFAIKVDQDRVAFRHKQAEAAKGLSSELYGTQSSMAALNMLDYETFIYFDPVRKRETHLSTAKVVTGLRTTNLETLSDDDVFIRQSFDDLLTKLEQIAGLFSIRYVRWSDIKALVGYYIDVVRSDERLKPAVVSYAET